ncbi:MAG: YqaA family protein [Sandaracinaceae bacterium]
MSGEQEPLDESVADAPQPWYRWPGAQVRRLYDWTLSWAGSRYSAPALFLLAFVEASFFPIPPDVLLMPMCLGKPKRSLVYASICSVGSVSGAVLGWYIGVSLWASLGVATECPEFGGGAWLFEYLPGFSCHKFETVQGLYESNAWVALFTAAFTPIPFKIFTIAAGVFQISLVTLLAASAVGRSARFFLVAGLIYKFGPEVKRFIEKRFELLTIAFTVLLLGGFALFKLLF